MAYLALEDGTLYEGTAFGSLKETVGEVVFNTDMTGYEEMLADPSYFGQLVCFTYPLIGNYGITFGEEKPKVHLKALIVRELCAAPSNWAARQPLDEFLREQGVCGIAGIDTRALVRKIREKGIMRGMITLDRPSRGQTEALKSFKVSCPLKEVSTMNIYAILGNGIYKVAVLDFGLRRSLLDSLKIRGFDITVYPYDIPAEKIMEDGCDGIVLSSGPGDPRDNGEVIAQIKKLIGWRPILGIGLGHLLLALAHGGDIGKLRHGHRGSNYPVKDAATGRVYITSQNHSFVAEEGSLSGVAAVTHVNWNDGSCEGLKYLSSPAFGVQFIPEALQDTAYIFDDFTGMVEQFKAREQ